MLRVPRERGCDGSAVFRKWTSRPPVPFPEDHIEITVAVEIAERGSRVAAGHGPNR
jgi:hypothetical protein